MKRMSDVDGDGAVAVSGTVPSHPSPAAGLPVVIQGGGARGTIVDGGGTDRVFDVYDGYTATISGVTITGP